MWGSNSNGQCDVPKDLPTIVELGIGCYHVATLIRMMYCMVGENKEKELFATNLTLKEVTFTIQANILCFLY